MVSLSEVGRGPETRSHGQSVRSRGSETRSHMERGSKQGGLYAATRSHGQSVESIQEPRDKKSGPVCSKYTGALRQEVMASV